MDLFPIILIGKAIAVFSIKHIKEISDYYIVLVNNPTIADLTESIELAELNIKQAQIAMNFGKAWMRLFGVNRAMFFSQPAGERPKLMLSATEAKDRTPQVNM